MSPIMWNNTEDTFEVFDPTCCDQPMNDTGCDAPSCRGYACDSCGSGCDIEVSPRGKCAAELDAEGEEERGARIDRERAVFGLASLSELGDQK